jgi:xanthine/uracil permease
VVLIQTVLHRSTYWSRYHTTTWRILAGYWAAAAVVAVILAVLRPWLGRRGGAALAGLLGGAAVYGVVGFVSSEASELGVVFVTAILGGLIGLGLGLVFYDDDHSERMSEEREGHRIAVMIAGGLVLIFLVWAMTHPPLCWLGGKYCR